MAPLRPTLAREAAVWANAGLLVGVDEVGRGPLAGPVVAAAVVFPPDAPRILGIRDSKVLPEPRRRTLARRIRERALYVGVGAASAREIDRLNIRVATALAMRRALRRLPDDPRIAAAPSYHVLLDGLPLPEIGCEHEALVDADALCYSVAAAGIVAKTVRDELMVRLARRHPEYGWEANKGYGTAEHCAALQRVGPSRHHRRSFAPVFQLELGLDPVAAAGAGEAAYLGRPAPALEGGWVWGRWWPRTRE